MKPKKKQLYSIKPYEEEIAVDESSMAPMLRGLSKQRLTRFNCLIEYAHNDNRIKWKDSMVQTFLFASFIHVFFYFHTI